MSSALELYGLALRDRAEVSVRFPDGERAALPVARWIARADTVDERLLEGVRGPVLDVGCGPGRHLRALTQRGVFALGVDISQAAVAIARGGGARAIVGDVFGELPGAGTWHTALLLDGNIGIGGSPRRLLGRLRRLLHPAGVVLVELESPDRCPTGEMARLEIGEEVSAWFPWARVSASQIGGEATAAGFSAGPAFSLDDRWFAELSPA